MAIHQTWQFSETSSLKILSSSIDGNTLASDSKPSCQLETGRLRWPLSSLEHLHIWLLLEYPIPLSVLCPPLSVTKIRITSVLAVFLKLGQMDFSKASNSISHHLTLVFPENCRIFRFFGWVGGDKRVDYLRGSHGLSARRARRTKSVPVGPPTRSQGPEGP